MTSGAWPLGWSTADLVDAASFRRGIGCIFDSTLVGSAATVDVSSIVSSYAHLLIVAYARSDSATPVISTNLRFNGDAAANYDTQILAGTGAAPVASETFAGTSTVPGNIPANTAGANLFGVHVTWIPNYAGSTGNKLCLSMSSYKTGTSTGNMGGWIVGGHWRSNAAITRVTLLPAAGNFVAGTRVSVYAMGGS